MNLREFLVGVKHKSAKDMAEQISQLHKDICQILESTNEEYKHYVNQNRRFKSFTIGKLVVVHLGKDRHPMALVAN